MLVFLSKSNRAVGFIQVLEITINVDIWLLLPTCHQKWMTTRVLPPYLPTCVAIKLRLYTVRYFFHECLDLYWRQEKVRVQNVQTMTKLHSNQMIRHLFHSSQSKTNSLPSQRNIHSFYFCCLQIKIFDVFFTCKKKKILLRRSLHKKTKQKIVWGNSSREKSFSSFFIVVLLVETQQQKQSAIFYFVYVKLPASRNASPCYTMKAS